MRGQALTPRADSMLSVVLVLQCVGAVGIALRGGDLVELVGTGTALAAALAVASGGPVRLAYGAAAWFFAAPLVEAITGSHESASLAPIAEAARWAVPVAIAQPRLAQPLLRVAASATFAGHGLMAIGLKPIFMAYLQHGTGLVGLDLSFDEAAGLLRIIGTIDVVLAFTLWLPKTSRFSAGYMFVWGTLTAAVRTIYGGPAGVADTLLRAANGGTPLWLARRSLKRRA